MGEEVWDEKTGTYHKEQGWIQVLLKKAVSAEMKIETVKRNEILTMKKGSAAGLKGHGVKAFHAMRKAKREGYDAVIFMADADTKDKKEWKQKHKDIVNGFAAAETDRIGVACLPKAASESWLLSDDSAWLHLCGKKVKLPPKPEDLSGERSAPKSDHPHRIFRRVCDECGCPDSRETRCAVADGSSIEKIGEKCPLSFNKFLDDLKPLNKL